MKGIYTLEAIPPLCKVIQTRVEVVRWMGHRVLLRDLEMTAKGIEYLIETDFASFQPDLECHETHLL